MKIAFLSLFVFAIGSIWLPNLLAQELEATEEHKSSYNSAADADKAPLLVKVERIKKVSGQLHFQLFSCPQNEELEWRNLEVLGQGKKVIEGAEVSFNFPGLRLGSYIVRVFQDLNGNQRLDYSTNAVPKEPTGFSNNPSLFLGVPAPIDTCIVHDAKDALVIKINNKRKKRRKRVGS